MRRSGEAPAIRIAVRTAVVLLILVAFAGCGVLTGSDEQEAIAVLTAVLNVFWDTLATADISYALGTFFYTSTDGAGGTFSFEWRADGSVELRFTGYTAPSCGYELNGVLTQGGEDFWGAGCAATEGVLTVTGAPDESQALDYRLFGELDETGRIGDDADFHGTIDGANIDEEWGLRPIAVRNHNLVVELRADVMP